LSDDVERDHYLNAIAKTIGVSQEALGKKFAKTEGAIAARQKRVKATPAQLDKASIENQKLQDNLLSLLLMRPTLREFLTDITSEMLCTESGQQLYAFLQANPDFDGKDAAAIKTFATKQAREVQNFSDYVKIESLLYEELYQGLELNELHYEAARLQARLIEAFVKTAKTNIADQLANADDQTSRLLLAKAKSLDKLLNKVKGA
jgi:hypothetical protein